MLNINRFCLLSKTVPPPHTHTHNLPVLITNNAKLAEYQVKLDEKYMPFLHCHSSLDGTSYKKLQDIVTSFQNLINSKLSKKGFSS